MDIVQQPADFLQGTGSIQGPRRIVERTEEVLGKLTLKVIVLHPWQYAWDQDCSAWIKENANY